MEYPDMMYGPGRDPWGFPPYYGPWGLWIPDPPQNPGRWEERDLEYWKSLYPLQVKELQSRVEEVGEELDYSGSPIYDEYPDRIALQRIVDRLREESEDPQAPWLEALLPVLLFQELHRRRLRKNRSRRWF